MRTLKFKLKKKSGNFYRKCQFFSEIYNKVTGNYETVCNQNSRYPTNCYTNRKRNKCKMKYYYDKKYGKVTEKRKRQFFFTGTVSSVRILNKQFKKKKEK